MPPRRRQREDDEPATPRPAKADADICAECWPDGWPEHARAAACAHGAYKR